MACGCGNRGCCPGPRQIGKRCDSKLGRHSPSTRNHKHLSNQVFHNRAGTSQTYFKQICLSSCKNTFRDRQCLQSYFESSENTISTFRFSMWSVSRGGTHDFHPGNGNACSPNSSFSNQRLQIDVKPHPRTVGPFA